MNNKKGGEAYKKELKKYVDNNLKKGFSKEQIEKKLLENKVPKKIIEEVISYSDKKKSSFTIVVLLVLVILIVGVVFVYFKFFSDKTITLNNFPQCLNKDTPIERYRCYRNESQQLSNVEPCGWYHIDYWELNENITYKKLLQEGEIIFEIDTLKALNYLTNERIIEYWNTKKPGESSMLKTDRGTYELTYITGIEEGIYKGVPYLPLLWGTAYCKI